MKEIAFFSQIRSETFVRLFEFGDFGRAAPSGAEWPMIQVSSEGDGERRSRTEMHEPERVSTKSRRSKPAACSAGVRDGAEARPATRSDRE